MWDRIRLKNFKAHTDTSLEPGLITVLVGPNGAGKTSLLQAAHYLSQLPYKSSRMLFAPHSPRAPYFLFNRKARHPISIEVSRLAGSAPWSVAVEIQPDLKTPDIEETDWMYRCVWRYGDDKVQQTDWTDDLALGRVLPQDLLDELKAAAYYRFNPRQLAAPTYSEHRVPRVEFDGGGLATVVAYLMTAQRETFEHLMAALRTVVPSVKDVRVKPALVSRAVTEFVEAGEEVKEVEKVRRVSGQEIWFDFEGAADIPAHSASDGTLIALGLLTVVFSPSKPRVILLDDLEQSLHPQAQRRLVEQIRSASEYVPDLQILATTHSPYLVDGLKPSEIWVVHRDSRGQLRCKALARHPRAKRALEILTTGEFWAAEGDDWVDEPTK